MVAVFAATEVLSGPPEKSSHFTNDMLALLDLTEAIVGYRASDALVARTCITASSVGEASASGIPGLSACSVVCGSQ